MTPVESASPPLDSLLAAMAPPTLPAAWVAPLEQQLTRDEKVLAALEIDLDVGLATVAAKLSLDHQGAY